MIGTSRIGYLLEKGKYLSNYLEMSERFCKLHQNKDYACTKSIKRKMEDRLRQGNVHVESCCHEGLPRLSGEEARQEEIEWEKKRKCLQLSLLKEIENEKEA
jgi:hypothetical protein